MVMAQGAWPGVRYYGCFWLLSTQAVVRGMVLQLRLSVQYVNMSGMASKIDHELRYRLLKLLEERPDINQRQLARELGLSLGKINYCLKALIAKGFVKARNFRNSRNKLAYAYLLTPRGIEEKVRLTLEYFRIVESQYEVLRREVEVLREQRAGCVAAPADDAETGIKT